MSLFNETDKRLLDKTLEIRERIVDNYIKKGLPESPKEIDSVTNLLESIDRSILGKAKLKIEESNTKNIEETKEAMISLLMNLHKANSFSNSKKEEKDLELNIDKEFNFRKEEFDTHIDTLTVDEFNERK